MPDLADMFLDVQMRAWKLCERGMRIRHNRDRWRWLARAYRRRAKEAREAERERVLRVISRHRMAYAARLEGPAFVALRKLEDEVTRG